MRGPATILLLATALTAVCAAAAPAPAAAAERIVVRSLSKAEQVAMTPTAWRPGCPVALAQLRVLVIPHRDFAGRARRGRLVVHHDVARDLVRAFSRITAAGVPLRSIHPIERFGGSDRRSVDADNTSAFNCRPVAGSNRWSQHAYGRAVDINPRENPYVRSDGHVRDPAARPFIRRSPPRRGMAVERGAMVRAFDAIGWSWGGRWSSDLDYQHFSRDGG